MVEREGLESAIKSLRNVKPEDLTDEKCDELDKAFKLLIKSGDKGISILYQELNNIEQNKENDDRFKLAAGTLLWELGKLDQTKKISQIWHSLPLSTQYNYVFFTAFEAAETQDPRVLPILSALLKDDKGEVYIYQHALTIDWPLTIEFVWGAYGPEGLNFLVDILKNSNNEIEIRSAISQLTNAFHLESLPLIRELAFHENKNIHLQAIRSLGRFGHPDDYELLISGLKSENIKKILGHIWALYEYEDLRAVSHLIPLLDSEDEELRLDVIDTLDHLKNPQSLETLHELSLRTKRKKEKKECQESVDGTLHGLSLNWEEFARRSDIQKKNLLDGFIQEYYYDQYMLGPDDDRLTRREFEKFIEDSIKEGYFEGYDVSDILSITSPKDIPLLRKVMAKIYLRLSDECLYEIRDLKIIIKRLGRSLYRKDVSICDVVKPR